MLAVAAALAVEVLLGRVLRVVGLGMVQDGIVSPPRSSISVPTVVLITVTALVMMNQLSVVRLVKGEVPYLWLTWPFALIYALYVTAVLLVCAAVVAHLRRRSLPPVPLLPARWRTHRKTYLVLGACVVLFTLLREGAFGPTCVVGYDAPHVEERTTRSPSGTHIATKGESPPDVMAGRPVHCNLDCVYPEPFCEAVVASLSCVDHEPTPDTVMVRGTVSMTPDFGLACYLPLYKRSDISFHAELELKLLTERTDTTAWSSADVALERTDIGPLSCDSLRMRLAGALARELAEVLQRKLNDN